jgi:hypothetical protein
LISLIKVRALDLDAPTAPGRPHYVSAASGLVSHGPFLYVIADDEHHLGIFRRDDAAPGKHLRLIEGDLPHEYKARKKAKPDFEALALLPPFAGYPQGALLAAGSGSKANRRQGALLAIGADGKVHGEARLVDLGLLMSPLEAEFGKLNIEGLVVAGEELRVLQRGNKGHKRNAVARFALAPFLDSLTRAGSILLAPLSITDYDLGEIRGVPLTFTDAAMLPTGDMVFSAVGEDTEDSYADGVCTGTAIGLIAGDGTLRWIKPVAETCKIEGVSARLNGDALSLLLVTDADDIAIPAALFAAEIGLGG